MSRRAHQWSRILKRTDWVSVLAICALVVIGIFFIRSAGMHSPVRAGLYVRQLGWVAMGGGLFAVLLLTDYRRILQQSVWLYLIALVLLALVLGMGEKINGARRWLMFFGTQVQPSEFAKLATVLMMARFLGRDDLDAREWSTVLKVAAIAIPPFFLIMVEPDLGTAAVLVPVAAAMLFAAGMRMRVLLAIALPVVLGAGVLVWAAKYHPELGGQVLDEYQLKRIQVFLGVERDPLGAGWNKIQSVIAVGSGGIWGKGYGEGTQNILGYLPQPVAPTDFIFSVVAEESGFAGSLVLLGLYAAVLMGGLKAALGAPDRAGRVLAVGLATQVFVHAFVNMAMTIGLMPITGVPLPLISYGGSFMVATMLGLGLMHSVGARRITAWGRV